MKKLLTIAFLLFVSSNSSVSFAFDAGTINSDLVRDMVIHDAMKRETRKVEIQQKEKAATDNTPIKNASQAALSDIKYVSFINNSSIPSKELFSVVQNYVNQPMNVQNVSLIRKEIMKYYQKKGFYSALVTINSENTQTGELVLNVVEGGKNSITVTP